MYFKDIIGQQSTKNVLREMVRHDRMPHAQMFLGPQGSGKLALAFAFAQYVMCENRRPEESCGECPNCKKSLKKIHPDIHYSYPVIGAKMISSTYLESWRSATQNPYLDVNQWLQYIDAENKQGNITKEECVNIIKKLSLKTFEGAYKILIIWLPEYLRKEGNRLLKLIEEPPENTLFILVAEDQELILNTILSRCQLVKIKSLSDEDVIDGLRSREHISAEEAQAIAHLADGNYNEALKLKDQRENNFTVLFLDWMRKCYQGNGVMMVNWVEKFAGIGRENQKHFLKYALHFLREYLILKMTGNQQVRLSEAELKTAQNLTKVIEYHQIEQIAALFDECSYHVERNANPKILFLDASINLNKILKTKVLQVS